MPLPKDKAFDVLVESVRIAKEMIDRGNPTQQQWDTIELNLRNAHAAALYLCQQMRNPQ